MVGGSLYRNVRRPQIYNTCPVINPDGEVVCEYDKIYPFLPY